MTPTQVPESKSAILVCDACGQWTRHTYDSSRDLTNQRNDRMAVEYLWRSVCCRAVRRWGIDAPGFFKGSRPPGKV